MYDSTLSQPLAVLPISWAKTLQKYQILVFVVVMLSVQTTVAYLVDHQVLRKGYFEWSFLVKPGTALAIIFLLEGKDGIWDVCKSMLRIRLHWGWYAVAFLLMPAILLATVYVHRLLTGTLHVPVKYDFWSFTGWYPRTWFGMTAMSVADEVAFFSFTYKRLAPRFTGIRAAMITAAIWTISYAPRLSMDSGMMADSTMPLWVLGAFFFTVAPICAWVYGSTKSAFLVVVLQLVANFGTLSLPILPVHTGTNWVYITQSVLMAIISVLLVRIYGAKYLNVQRAPLSAKTAPTS